MKTICSVLPSTICIILYATMFSIGLPYHLAFAQSTKIDSLKDHLQTVLHDTFRVQILIELCYQYRNSNSEKAIEYGKQGLHIAKEITYKKGIANCLNSIGGVYRGQGASAKALEYYKKSLEIRKELKDKYLMANTLGVIGRLQYNMGNYPAALDNYIRSLKLYEQLLELPPGQDNLGRDSEISRKYKIGKSTILNFTGSVFKRQHDFNNALEYYFKALQISENLNEMDQMASSFNRIGIVYQIQEDTENAIKYFLKALKIREQQGHKVTISASLTNIGIFYKDEGNHKQALVYYLKALKMQEETEDNQGIAITLINMGQLYIELGNYQKAISSLLKSLTISRELKFNDLIKETYQGISHIYALQKKFKKAFEYHFLYSQIKDSLFNETSSEQIAEMQTRYESEKKQKEIELLTKDKEIKDLALLRKEAEVKKQRVIIFSTIGILALALTLALILYNRYKTKQKTNMQLERKNASILHQKQEIEKQKKEIEKQKEIVEIKNRDITDSIEYAKNIQQAILPKNQKIKSAFPEHFVFFQPLDIVSGDFYWFSPVKQNGNKNYIIAAVDCTGHGVPGAFVSMIGNDLLNQIIIEKGITRPSEILECLNTGVKFALNQNQEDASTFDGMDMALCNVDLKNKRVEYSGALRPLYIIRNNNVSDDKKQDSEGPFSILEEIKAENAGIGGIDYHEKRFIDHKMHLNKGDTFYIFSDGITDQFGGPKNKKYSSSRLRNFLCSIQGYNMEKQYDIMKNEIESWKGDLKQTDDIMIIGIRI
ncbi:tetratricopeptide repeat protein [Bacteroidales bacterium AH-315-N07]|nr:tetratricopeptide repeat protein [Bacteroidales bacterium AH-315-N07]